MEIPFRPLGEFENKYSSRQTFADYDFDILTAGLSVAKCKFLWWKCSDTLRRFDFEWSACLRFSQELNDIDVLPLQQALDGVRQRFWQAQFKQRSFAHTQPTNTYLHVIMKTKNFAQHETRKFSDGMCHKRSGAKHEMYLHRICV